MRGDLSCCAAERLTGRRAGVGPGSRALVHPRAFTYCTRAGAQIAGHCNGLHSADVHAVGVFGIPFPTLGVMSSHRPEPRDL